MILRVLLAVLISVVVTFLGLTRAAGTELSENEQRLGWKPLLGDTLSNQWHGFRLHGLPDGWILEEGVLKREEDAVVNLLTTSAFESFELSLEYRVSEAASSGVLFRVDETEDDASHSGPEVQIADNQSTDEPDKSGWLVGLIAASRRRPEGDRPIDATRPVGEWNHLQLLVNQRNNEVNLNGNRYYNFNLTGDDWRRRVAASPFAKYENFAKANKGFICLQTGKGTVWFRNIKLRELPANGVVNDPVDGTLATKVEPAFPKLKWADWEPINEDGLNEPFRPIVVTHAGDGSDRIFVATQHGTIHVFPNDQEATESKIFLNIRKQVRYSDKENEEGFLGLAFHPRYRETGEFFVYYTAREMPRASVISRFRVSRDDPNIADPSSEEELLRIPQPYWNHNGGTLAFGPDGYLYIGLGDGGSANDPHGNGQNLGTLLGSILRIDIDSRSGNQPYAIPSDNPFVHLPNAQPEIFAYGFRNVWRLSFDRRTKLLWAADVGQNLWEEINLVHKGGNYGWAFREGTHAFGPKTPERPTELIDPIWEYDHQVGKSITGGMVYRGQRVPELAGKYLYADYVTGKIWALDYDISKQRVRGNYRIESPMLPIVTFGEDEHGEAYFAIVAANGKGLFHFSPAAASAP
jgi:glucose/arabinose dehydrogenase